MNVGASRMVAALAALCIGACVAARGVALDPGHYLSGDVAAYDRAMLAGLEALRAGDFRRAEERLHEALRIPRDEVPNYEAFVPLAIAACRQGDRSTGRALLADAACMLSVEDGVLACPLAGPPDAFVQQGGTRRCYETMCGELFLSYYASPTPEQRARVKALREDVAAGGAECR